MKLKNFYEASVPEGLEEVAWNEITTRHGDAVKLLTSHEQIEAHPGVLQFTYGGDPKRLLGLRTVLSLFWGRCYDVPRPKALLGHEYFTSLMELISTVMELSPFGSYRTVYLAAAGSETEVMQRLIDDIAKGMMLKAAKEEGDLLVRVRRPLDGADGWETLVRMTPRPLSVRKWRVCDYTGALNAAVAHALVLLTEPSEQDVFFNPACGSGTILIERAFIKGAKQLCGCDVNAEALVCAQKNVVAAGYVTDETEEKKKQFKKVKPVLDLPKAMIELYPWDMRALPLADASVDVVCSDLPFGHDVGSHEENLLLYPHLFKEIARVAKPGARGVFLTHELRLTETVLNVSPDWTLENVVQITINGLHPRIYVVRKVDGTA
jgi:tRNA (guanine6-N2)-methyltransferase